MNIKISDLSVKKIENGEFNLEIQELYNLKNFVENNNAHKKDSVFNHTMNALREYEKFLKNLDNNIKKYLSQKIGTYKREELLFLAVLFHDIAKPETFQDKDGITSCLGHEKLGSQKVKKILDRFDLQKDEVEIIKNTIKYHDKIHGIVRSRSEIVLDKEIKDFKKQYKDVFAELIILAIVDVRGSQLAQNYPDRFVFRDLYYKKILTLI